MLLSVNKSRMRQMMDRLKKTMGADETTTAGLKLADEEAHPPKPAAAPAPAPSATGIAPKAAVAAPMGLKLKG